MAIRGLWLISHEKGGIGVVKFSRRYPTVEKRAKAFNGESYVNIPEDDLLLPALLTELGLTDPDKNFVEYRDSCSRINKTSVYALPVGEGHLWPVLAIPNNDLLYVCVPLVEQSMNPLPPLITISGISEAFTLLAGLMGFISSGQKNETDFCAKVAQLPVLLTQACPLGSPTDSNLQGLLDSNTGGPGNQIQKQPAWKTSKYKGKAQVKVCISEKVKCMQYDKKDVTDMWQVHGTVTCKVPVPPILGFYQMQEEELKLKITVNLKLHESVKNGFEYCEARIPFFNRGSIAHFEHKLSYGQLEVLREKGVLVWVIGQKFPKSLEISLTGTLTFGSVSQLQQPSNPICTGNTAYVKLYFRIPDYTLSGCYTDQHSIQVFSSAKPKIITSRELISSDYYIWNSKAPAPVVYRSPFL
uniref:AP-5 complex subunit mu-1 n=1 Tax=Geotrypetes seraphini TaxID=260995 RepID=A0A6P8RPA1_GEOSA|nr:AP-5 complex subunit mu-1 isoform X2 [Geotrypetes seraphini]